MSTNEQPNTQKLGIAKVRWDGDTQSRAALDQDTVKEYAELIEDGAAFPPVEAYYDGEHFWLSSGFHRCAAYERLGRTHIEVKVLEGSRHDAQWASFGANKAHGLRLSHEDTRRVLRLIFAGPVWKGRTQREIAAHVGCSKGTVSKELAKFRETGQEGPKSPMPSRARPGPRGTAAVAAKRDDTSPDEVGAAEREGGDPTGGPGIVEGVHHPPFPAGSHEDATEEPRDTSTMANAMASRYPWDAFNSAIRAEVIAKLREVYRALAKITQYDSKTKRMNGRFAQGYSPAGTLSHITALAKLLDDGLPAEPSDQHPGYIIKARVKIRDSLKKA